MQILLGLALAAIISLLAWHFHSLSADGAVAATGLGTIVFGLGGWTWAVLLLIFFSSSSALTYAFKSRKRTLVEDYAKGGRRDAGQVLSNGGIAGLFVVLHLLYAQATWPWLGFAAALAAVNADTWATELGVLDRFPPRLITNLRKPVSKGTSGGLSVVGTLAALLGSVVVGAAAAAFSTSDQWLWFGLISVSGLLGSLLDSLLGATVQAMYFCPTDRKETERYPLHSCGTATIHIRGWRWLNNDWVNLACSLGGVLAAEILMAATLR